MADKTSRLQRLAAAARAHAAAERQREATVLERIERAHERQLAKQRQIVDKQLQIQERMARHAAKPGSRRGRLQPSDVIAAALTLLDERGIDGVTLRDVASQLRVQAPALYWHFASKSDIVDGMAHSMLSNFVSGLEPPEDAAEWRPWLRQAAHGLRDAMLTHRDGARIVAGAGLGRARSLAELLEKMLAVLERAGFDPVTASAGTRAVISYAFGAVIEEQAPPPEDVPEPQIKEFLKDYPGIARSIDAQLRLSPGAQFDMGLELILRGLDTRR